MSEPKYLFGVYYFEDGVRPVLMWRGVKYFHAIYIDSVTLLKRYVLFDELKYFKELGNSNENLKGIKRVARYMIGPNKCCGIRREMIKATRKILKDCIAYEDTEQN